MEKEKSHRDGRNFQNATMPSPTHMRRQGTSLHTRRFPARGAHPPPDVAKRAPRFAVARDLAGNARKYDNVLPPFPDRKER
jgi:hypothetical protein